MAALAPPLLPMPEQLPTVFTPQFCAVDPLVIGVLVATSARKRVVCGAQYG